MLNGLSRSGERPAGWSRAEATVIGKNYNSVTLTMQGGESLAERYSRLAQETPDRRRVDFELRALDLFLSSVFLGVRAFDGILMAAAAALLGGVAVTASWWPARRAMRVDPMTALKQ